MLNDTPTVTKTCTVCILFHDRATWLEDRHISNISAQDSKSDICGDFQEESGCKINETSRQAKKKVNINPSKRKKLIHVFFHSRSVSCGAKDACLACRKPWVQF